MFDYLRDDMNRRFDEIRDDQKEIKQMLSDHIKNDSDSFAALGERFSKVERNTVKTNAIGGFKEKVFSHTTTWMIAIGSMAVALITWFK